MEPGIKICCICGKKFTGCGHSPYQFKEEHFECCDECNTRVVLPNRLELKKQHGAMKTGLEKIKAYIEKQTENMENTTKIELLYGLTWWALEKAGVLDFESADIEDYD